MSISQAEDKVQSFFISTPIYYVNASPHLGHAYTTIVADCVNRFHKLLDQETFFLTGTDEHGDKIVQAAQENGQYPQEYADRISAQFKELWPRLGIEFDRFVRTSEAAHKECVQRFLQLVYDKGDIYFGEYGGYYCFGCECFYTERELQDGFCPDHQKKPEYIKEKNYFFRMSKYQDWLREYIQQDLDFIRPEQYRNEVLAMLREPLDDLCISRPKKRLDWGVELPFDSDYVTYVWFDALLNYISALDWPQGEKFKQFWPAAHHLVAKDILKPHAIFWPTMLKAAGLEPYKALRVHGYWKVQEAKMSKSLGNVVDPLQLRDKYGLDGFRYFLLRDMHFGHDGSFSEEGLVQRFNSDLANDLGNLFNRTLAMNKKYHQGVVPGPGQEVQQEDQELVRLGLQCLQEYIRSFQDFDFAQGLERLWELIRALNKYIDRQAPWELYKQGYKERLASVMAVVLAGLRKVCLALWPVMPDASQTLGLQLGFEVNPQTVDLREEAGNWQPLQPGTQLAAKSNLFPRQERILAEQEAAADDKAQGAQEAIKSGADQADLLDIADFKRLELKVGRIEAARPHPEADRLLILEVDLGQGQNRQIVAGLAEHYACSELEGSQVLVAANLKPAKLRGVWSQGMVLAAQDKKSLSLIAPLQEMQLGSRVS
ncbi:MAG: methionine--tRNA ligase [Desulfohalobiaceae bacterium]